MSNQKPFQRSPRMIPPAVRGEEELKLPENAPARPNASLTSRLEDVAFTGGASLAGAVLMHLFQPQMHGSMLLGGVSMFGFGVMRGVMAYRREVKQFEKLTAQREEKHESYLKSRRESLAESRDLQRNAMLGLDPSPLDCLRRAEAADIRLFERSPGDADFLSFRLGLGDRSFGIKLKSPILDKADKDPLNLKTATLAQEFSCVDSAPICASFRDLGAGGIAGPRAQAIEAVRCMLVQLATHHSPEEVKVAIIYPPEEDWSWARWLPHVFSEPGGRRFLANDEAGARALLEELNDLLKRRALRQKEDDSKKGMELPVFVIVLASATFTRNHPLLDVLQSSGSRVGALGLFFGDVIKELPQSCRTLVEVGPGQPRLVHTQPEASEEHYEADSIPVAKAEELARALAGLRVKGASSTGDIPTKASMLDLAGVERIEQHDAVARWKANTPFKSMAVPIGFQAGGKVLELNLHETVHGPHGLVAGTTGSGKTAFLSTFLGLLAVQFHPHEVAFVCVDYKGGDLFRGLEELPHLVGTLTNLEKSEVWRCLRALQAENERRMRLFSKASTETGVAVNKIDEYQELMRQGRAPEPLPKLLIVCDEFAELSKQEPEFIGRLVSIARVGRSLGVHLILATQQPAGIIGDQIESNTRFRMAFKFNKEEDSKAVIKRPEAASIRQSGRGYFQLGENEIFELFQAAYGGAEYRPNQKKVDEPRILEILLDGRRRQLGGPAEAPVASQGKARTQLQEMSHHLAVSAEKAGIQRLPGPWLPPLKSLILLQHVAEDEGGWNGKVWQPTPGWLEPLVGVVDDPARSFQGPLRISLARDGHVAVYGRPGAGCTSLLQTMIISLARAHSPAELNFYIMDFGGRALARLKHLPHTGDVVVAEEADRTQRLLRFLLRQLQKRKEILAAAGASTLTAYRAAAAGEPIPAVVLVLDNYLRFSKDYPEAEDLLASLVQEGGNLGIYVMLSAGSPSGVKPKTGGNINNVLCLQLADRTEYALAVGRGEGVEPGPVVGRGLVRGKPPLEFQTALAFEGESEIDRAAAQDGLLEMMSRAWTGPRPAPVPMVPEVVTLDLLVPEIKMEGRGPATGAPIGLDIDDVSPFRLAPADGPHFFFTGAMQSGKTNLATVWLLSLAANMAPSDLEIIVVDFREGLLQPLSRLPHVSRFVDNDDDFGKALTYLKELGEQRKAAMKEARMAAGGVLDDAAWTATQKTHLLVIDDFEAMRSAASALNQEELLNVIKAARGPGIHVVLLGSVDDMGANTYDSTFKAISAYKTGILLGCRDDNGVFNNVRIPAQGDIVRGTGYFVQRGLARARLTIARPGAEAKALLEWLDRLCQAAGDSPAAQEQPADVL